MYGPYLKRGYSIAMSVYRRVNRTFYDPKSMCILILYVLIREGFITIFGSMNHVRGLFLLLLAVLKVSQGFRPNKCCCLDCLWKKLMYQKPIPNISFGNFSS